MDDIPVERIKDFQTRLTEFLSLRNAELLQKIASEKTLSEGLVAELSAATDAFKQTWE
jgi:F-type H+-transporting ATPase subunit alpha